jgi:hypothetical protein
MEWTEEQAAVRITVQKWKPIEKAGKISVQWTCYWGSSHQCGCEGLAEELHSTHSSVSMIDLIPPLGSITPAVLLY